MRETQLNNLIRNQFNGERVQFVNCNLLSQLSYRFNIEPMVYMTIIL